MLDPIPVPLGLRDAAKPFTDVLHLHTLPLHIHEVLSSFALYTLIYEVISPYCTVLLLPGRYSKFPAHTKLQWHMHVTAFVNSILLSVAALYVIFADKDRLSATWEDRIWGYTGAGGFVQALGAGYFLWDVQVCTTNFGSLGYLDLIHSAVALSIAILGFRPFGLSYGIQYALVELSSPFANIHWFLNKMDRAGSAFQIVNGVILIITFGCCRLLWGAYLTVAFFMDAWTALHHHGSTWTEYDYSPSQKPLVLEHKAVWWLTTIIMMSNAVVMILSAFWFYKMIAMLKGYLASTNKDTAIPRSKAE